GDNPACPMISRSEIRTSAARARKRGDPLSATLASGALARLLIDLAVHPDETPHGRELQLRTGLTPRSLQAELVRLESLGIIQRRADGHVTRYVLDESNPRWRALRDLVRELADPADVLRDALADVPGVASAFVFGSMARKDFREESDIDLFILDEGVPDDLLARRTLEVGVLLRREVNVVQMNAAELARRVASGSGFVRDVLSGAKLWVIGNQEELDVAIAGEGRVSA
ncbi:MAG TPA: nucleotidyltransferase domain-containing protein, partial [Longimicrobium sp.]